MQSLFLDTVCAAALKLHILNQCHEMTVYAKSHNTGWNFNSIMPLGLKDTHSVTATKFLQTVFIIKIVQ